MRLLGVLFLIIGVLALTAGLVIGMPFSGIYLLGFVGTGGREAGRELLLFLPATLAVCGVGYALIKLGKRLRADPKREA
jgi:hypothetical protein